jgi:hypothetical protein
MAAAIAGALVLLSLYQFAAWAAPRREIDAQSEIGDEDDGEQYDDDAVDEDDDDAQWQSSTTRGRGKNPLRIVMNRRSESASRR